MILLLLFVAAMALWELPEQYAALLVAVCIVCVTAMAIWAPGVLR